MGLSCDSPMCDPEILSTKSTITSRRREADQVHAGDTAPFVRCDGATNRRFHIVQQRCGLSYRHALAHRVANLHVVVHVGDGRLDGGGAGAVDAQSLLHIS